MFNKPDDKKKLHLPGLTDIDSSTDKIWRRSDQN